MLLRNTAAGQLRRNDAELQLKLIDGSLRHFSEFLTILPTEQELATCRSLVLDFSLLRPAYPSTAAVLAAWFRKHESVFDADNFEVDFDPPNDRGVERW